MNIIQTINKNKPEIRQHIPAFITGIKPKTVNFKTQDDLLNIDFVKQKIIEKFFQFSISGNILMAEYDNGEYYFVIGYLKHIENTPLNLPLWSKKH